MQYKKMTIRGGITCLLLLSNILNTLQSSEAEITNEWRIVNGIDGSIDEMPSIVSIRVNHKHACGGTVLTQHWILSAAHCFLVIPEARLLTVLAGKTKISPSADNMVHEVSHFINHPDFHANFLDNDVSLLKLATPLSFSKVIQPVRLPGVCAEVVWHGMSVRVGGWGLVNESHMPEVLQFLDYYVIPNEECRSFHHHPIYDTNICAVHPHGGKAECNGDSGGPLMHNGVQVGIVSWNTKPCGGGNPGIFTKVSNFIRFIYMHTDLDMDTVQFAQCPLMSKPTCERCYDRLSKGTKHICNKVVSTI
ncbi:trypsin-like isoform X2 [Topomyia yanbarensis]|uniref:trypsin-like isoform X2 n=1 Tax=Topomyia yanbarensis TaxID=2498891 RepID=UPI00273AADBF|nr:trypsin-like isoform X2 [Topomyia yanbarensis]